MNIVPNGTETGLSDSDGKVICIGDVIKKPVEINKELHGEWALYRVEARGITPVFKYVSSENGKVLPEGLEGAPLCELYDAKMFMFMQNLSELRPDEKTTVHSPYQGTDH